LRSNIFGTNGDGIEAEPKCTIRFISAVETFEKASSCDSFSTGASGARKLVVIFEIEYKKFVVSASHEH
jgi:hypothetical protein